MTKSEAIVVTQPNWGVSRDMVEMSDQELVGLASKVFLLGLKDGRELSGPITADKLMMALPGHPHRIIHSQKLRQVYGAAFDIMKVHQRIRRGSVWMAIGPSGGEER